MFTLLSYQVKDGLFILWIHLFSGLNSRCVLHMASQSVDVLACRALPHIIYFVIGLDIGIARCPVCGFFIPCSFGFVISGVVCLHAYIKWLFRVPRPQTADCLCLPSPTTYYIANLSPIEWQDGKHWHDGWQCTGIHRFFIPFSSGLYSCASMLIIFDIKWFHQIHWPYKRVSEWRRCTGILPVFEYRMCLYACYIK